MKKFLVLSVALSALLSPSWQAEAVSDDAQLNNVRFALNMYACQRAWRKGDLLTVLVTESTLSTKQDNIATAKEMKADAEAPVFGSFGIPNTNLFTNINNDIAIPSYKIKASSSFKGTGSGTSSELLTASYGARVVDTLDNGLLVIRGERRVVMKHEEVNLVITGLVRSRDIAADNTIVSSKIADAHVYYENAGEITKGSNPGWFWRMFQFVNPF